GASWFSIRKEAKGHGRGAWVEGARLQPGQSVVLLDDVVSTGASLLRAAERVRELGVEVVAATTLLDRSPAVAWRLAAAGITWLPHPPWPAAGREPLCLLRAEPGGWPSRPLTQTRFASSGRGSRRPSPPASRSPKPWRWPHRRLTECRPTGSSC